MTTKKEFCTTMPDDVVSQVDALLLKLNNPLEVAVDVEAKTVKARTKKIVPAHIKDVHVLIPKETYDPAMALVKKLQADGMPTSFANLVTTALEATLADRVNTHSHNVVIGD
jgi:hypothetical protein